MTETEEDDDQEDDCYQVTLHQSNLLTESCMKVFVAEAISSAILNSGATSTVARKDWMDFNVRLLIFRKAAFDHIFKFR